MTRQSRPSYPVDPVQHTYARVLAAVVVLDLVLLAAGLVLYASGALPSSIEVGSVPDVWHLSAQALAAEIGDGTRAWIESPGEGRSLAFASLVAFPASMIVMTGVAAVLYLRHRRVVYAVITLAVLVVFVLAALGFVS